MREGIAHVHVELHTPSSLTHMHEGGSLPCAHGHGQHIRPPAGAPTPPTSFYCALAPTCLDFRKIA